MVWRRSIGALSLLTAMVIGTVLFFSRERWRAAGGCDRLARVAPLEVTRTDAPTRPSVGASGVGEPQLGRRRVVPVHHRASCEAKAPEKTAGRGSTEIGLSRAVAPDSAFVPQPLARVAFPRPSPRHNAPVPLPDEGAKLERTPGTVKAILLAATARLRELYRNQLRLDPSLQGDLEVRLEVEPLGRVSRVEVVGGSLAETPLCEVVVGELSKVVFPAKSDAQGRELYRQRFVFQPRT